MATIKLNSIRTEIREQKGTVSQCIKMVVALCDESKSLKAICPKKSDLQLLAGHIYETMGVGRPVVTKRCTYIRKCSVDLVLRYLVANQDNLKHLIAAAKEKAAEKEVVVEEKKAKKARKATETSVSVAA